MERAHWNRIEELLQAALDHPPDERSAFLDDALAGEPALRREVDSLLAQEGSGAALSESPVSATLASGASSAPAGLTGKRIGHYLVSGRIGAGGMGEVYEAQDERLQRPVAIKALPDDLASDGERSARFEQEALAVSRLNHPNIITLFEVRHDGKARYLVAERIEGQTLRELLTDPRTGEPRALALDRALDIAAQITAALQAAHTAWIIHRDVKPENVMVRPDGLVKVLDFGIAKQSGAPLAPDAAGAAGAPLRRFGPANGAPPALSSAVVGTRRYMSPEQARGEPLDGRTDLFSLGLVIYEMIAGHRYPSGSGAAPAESALLPLPGEIRSIVRKLLEADRERRYVSASALAADLERVRSRSSGRTARRMLAAGTIAIVMAAAATTLAALASITERWEEHVLRDGHAAAARQAVFSPDGRSVVSAGEDGQVIVWDFASRKRLANLTGQRAHKLAFSPDGRWLVTGGVDGTLQVWDARRRTLLRNLRGPRAEVGALGFSPDGSLLVSSASAATVSETLAWDTRTWSRTRDFPGGVSYGAVVFSHDMAQLTLGAGWQTFDVTSGKLLAADPSIDANWAAVSPDGSTAATVGTRGHVAFYRLTDPTDLREPTLLTRRRGHQDHGRAIAYSPDGRLVASGSEAILLWDAATHRKVARLEHSSIVWSLAFHPGGRWLISSHADGAVLIWDVAERELLANLGEHSGAVRAVAFSPDGRLLATGGEDRTVMLWDARGRRKLAALAGHETRVTGVAFLPGAARLASVDQDGVVMLWHAAGGGRHELVRLDSPISAYTLASSPDGLLATSHGLYGTSGGGRIVGFHDGPDWRLGSVYGVAFSSDGRRLACVTETGWVMVFETAGGRLVERRRIPDAHVIAVDISNDGRWLVTGEDQGPIRLWSLSPLREVAVLGRHTARVKSVAFSPDGSIVASAGDDRIIALWTVSGRRLRATVGTHASPVYSVAFSPDGRHLVSGEHDRSVRIYTRQRSLWGLRLDQAP